MTTNLAPPLLLPPVANTGHIGTPPCGYRTGMHINRDHKTVTSHHFRIEIAAQDSLSNTLPRCLNRCGALRTQICTSLTLGTPTQQSDTRRVPLSKNNPGQANTTHHFNYRRSKFSCASLGQDGCMRRPGRCRVAAPESTRRRVTCMVFVLLLVDIVRAAVARARLQSGQGQGAGCRPL